VKLGLGSATLLHERRLGTHTVAGWAHVVTARVELLREQ
jgi:hypothetical protein